MCASIGRARAARWFAEVRRRRPPDLRRHTGQLF